MEELKLNRKASFKFIKDDEIEPKQQNMIEEIIETLGVSSGIAKTLLLKYRWDKEEVINRFTETDNLLKKVFNYDIDKTVKKIPLILCSVCYEEKTD